MGALGAGQVQALVVTVNDQRWDVTTFTGTYNDNVSKFATAANGGVMPWFNNIGLSYEFATAVAGGFGVTNNQNLSFQGGTGPWFGVEAYAPDPDQDPPFLGEISYVMSAFEPADGSWFTTGWADYMSVSGVWAQATPFNDDTPVPGPLPVFGAAAAFGFSRKLRKRIKDSKAVGGSITVD
jgi:hypothetical protein